MMRGDAATRSARMVVAGTLAWCAIAAPGHAELRGIWGWGGANRDL